MTWNCPECQKTNNSEIDAGKRDLVVRFCAFCGARATLDPDKGAAFLEKNVETGQIPAPRLTAKAGPGRPILVLLHGRKVGAELPLPIGRVRIGAAAADWDFPGEGLAPVHFQIDFLMGKCYVRDLTGGEEGITVNARPATYAELHNGDQIRAGKATFLFLMIFRDDKAEVEKALEAAPPLPSKMEAETGKSKLVPAPQPPPPPAPNIWDSVPDLTDGAAPVASTVIIPKRRTLDAGAPIREASIQIEAGPDTGQKVPLLFASNVIGRGLCEIPLADPLTSQRHAEVGKLQDGSYFLKDLASSNGTFLNGRQVQYSPLDSGDVIQIGETQLRFLVQ